MPATSVGVDASAAASQALGRKEEGTARTQWGGWQGEARHGGELQREWGSVMDAEVVGQREGLGTLPLTRATKTKRQPPRMRSRRAMRLPTGRAGSV